MRIRIRPEVSVRPRPAPPFRTVGQLTLFLPPSGSALAEQQITLYPHRDENNAWRITNGSSDSGPASYDWSALPLQYIENGARLGLEHVVTEKRLHSHEVRPPISEVEFQNEVSGYGFPGWVLFCFSVGRGL